jgi:hypothetical protein
MRDVEGLDVVVIMGGDSGMNELFVQSHIQTIEDLRGGRLIVDAPNTAFALQAYRILGDRALRRDLDYTVVSVGRGELRDRIFCPHQRNPAGAVECNDEDMVTIKDMASIIPIESLVVKGLNDITE